MIAAIDRSTELASGSSLRVGWQESQRPSMRKNLQRKATTARSAYGRRDRELQGDGRCQVAELGESSTCIEYKRRVYAARPEEGIFERLTRLAHVTPCACQTGHISASALYLALLACVRLRNSTNAPGLESHPVSAPSLQLSSLRWQTNQ